jgi:hypothetical protein
MFYIKILPSTHFVSCILSSRVDTLKFNSLRVSSQIDKLKPRTNACREIGWLFLM